MRGSRGEPASANASDDSDGCEVMPAMMLDGAVDHVDARVDGRQVRG